ncbi:MAG: DUF805 domain-containing protein [Muribaculaceae bacterium]|nr:DUF805 domain-containing protein [Muribaculaceae bacterium]
MDQYQVSFVDAIKRAFSNYCVFTGRASRSEYWWFFLFTYIVGMIVSGPQMMQAFKILSTAAAGGDITALQTTSFGFMGFLSNIVGLALFLPTLGLTFRRFHDAGHSGWNICWGFLPIIGPIILIIYLCQPSQPYPNKYGNVPNLR